MKKLLIKSTIAAFAIEIIGAAVNLISYAVNGRFLGLEWIWNAAKSYFSDVVSGSSRFRFYLDQF